MAREAGQDLRGWVGEIRQAVAQRRQRQAVDARNEKAHHRVEQSDLVLAVTIGAVEKQIGNLPQNRGAPVLRDLGERGVEIGQ